MPLVDIIDSITEWWLALENVVGEDRTLELVMLGAPRIVADCEGLKSALLEICARVGASLPKGGTVVIELSKKQEGGAVYAKIGVTGSAPEESEISHGASYAPLSESLGDGAEEFPAARRFVEAHGGRVEVAAAPVGQFISVTLYLPSLPPHGLNQTPAVKRKIPAEESGSPTPVGSAKIFVVDDEEIILGWIKASLLDAGYQIKTARSIEEAIQVFNADPNWADVALLDITLPDGSGYDLYSVLSKRRADLAFVICSGYGDGDDVRAFANEGRAVLTKPFNRERLEEFIARALQSNQVRK